MSAVKLWQETKQRYDWPSGKKTHGFLCGQVFRQFLSAPSSSPISFVVGALPPPECASPPPSSAVIALQTLSYVDGRRSISLS